MRLGTKELQVEDSIAWQRGRELRESGFHEQRGFAINQRDSHTFRVDSCSKHLLAAPLIVQNVDAWKCNGN